MQRYCIFELLTNRNKKENMKTTILQSTLLFITLMLCFVNRSSAQDSTPPVLHSFTILTDTVYNQDSIFVTINVSDDISGVNWQDISVLLSFQDSSLAPLNGHLTINNWQNTQGNNYLGGVIIIDNF